MHFVAVKESQIPLGLGIYSSEKTSTFTAVRGGIQKGYLFCKKWYVKG